MNRAVALVVGGMTALALPPAALAQLPSAGDVADLLRTGPGTLPRVAEWASEACGSLTGEACAAYLELQPRWGRFTGAPGPSVLATFATGNTLGSTGVAVVTRLASGQLKLQIPQWGRVQSALMRGGRLRMVVDLMCSDGQGFRSFGHPRLQWYSMAGDTLVRSGRRARC
jgi:hypothetical protein